MSTSFKVVEVDGRWYVSFLDEDYHDYVIDFSKSFSSRDEAEKGVDFLLENSLLDNPMGK